MKASQKRFIARVLTIFMGLVTFLLVDATLSGALGLAGAVCLIPASAFVTNVLWHLSLRRVRHKGRARAARPAAEPLQPAPQALPTLYVVDGGGSQPDATGTEPPHVA